MSSHASSPAKHELEIAKKWVELWLYSCIIGYTLKIFMRYIGKLLGGTFVQLFMPYWNFEYTLENVGSGIGQDPATEVTHLGLNKPPVFSSVLYLEYSHSGGQ